MFGTKDLLSLIGDIGLVPTILLVAVALFFLHKEIKKSLSGLGSSLDKLREYTSSAIASLRTDMDARNVSQDERMEELESLLHSSMEKLHASTAKANRELRSELEARNLRQDARMEVLEKELKFIEREYVSKEQHFNDTEGWKANLDSLRRDLAEMPLKMIALIKEIKP